MKKAFALAAVALMTVVASLALSTPAYAEDKTTDGVSLGYDGGVSAEISLLQPQETYYFPVEFTQNGVTEPLSDQKSADLTLERLSGGTGISSAEVIGWNGASYLKIKTDNTRTERRYSTTYRLTYQDGRDEYGYEFTVNTGLRPANIGSVTAGEAIPVKDYMPLYTVKQQMEIARINRWRPVTFTGEGWSFTGTLTAKGPVDFTSSSRAIPEVKRFLEGDEVFYLSFSGGGNFQDGKLTVDVSEWADRWDGPVYAYRYLYGRLYRVPAVYDSESGSITLSVTNLGRYAITDRKLPEATIVE